MGMEIRHYHLSHEINMNQSELDSKKVRLFERLLSVAQRRRVQAFALTCLISRRRCTFKVVAFEALFPTWARVTRSSKLIMDCERPDL